jgi:glycosyltransferase involved in cell wall biosynthesis
VDGFLVPPRDVAAAAKHAVELLSDRDRLREMGKKARENAFWNYCSSKIIPRYEDYYRRVLSTASAARA